MLTTWQLVLAAMLSYKHDYRDSTMKLKRAPTFLDPFPSISVGPHYIKGFEILSQTVVENGMKNCFVVLLWLAIHCFSRGKIHAELNLHTYFPLQGGAKVGRSREKSGEIACYLNCRFKIRSFHIGFNASKPGILFI